MKKNRILSVLWLAFLTGCGPSFAAITTPPPTKSAQLVSHEGLFSGPKYTAKLSVGVALAINCEEHGPCKDVVATSSNPEVANVVSSHLNQLKRNWGDVGGMTLESTFVIYGVASGETTIAVRTADGHKKIRVTVVE